ncbi:butyrophilin subfamily 1 member A1-like isoform X2 [Myotis daubentonii]|uniref:butyrophilin subfamily 1 member A1-like isoform X2 n=1 Tax=Myotis daubentonii TaxID=98922 RepID=UPI00287390C9|nr:butyrophilin subfamily 1 member A1-like isoform X2 [Myotis daubentonii]
METLGHCSMPLRIDSHLKKSYQEVDNVHTITEASTLLSWLVFCFIFYIVKKERHISDNSVDIKELSSIIGELQPKIDKLLKILAGTESSYAVNVILDAATAHPVLLLSEDGKRVTWQEPCQDLPNSSQRFDSLPCVLGQKDISSGKCHWEVEVGDMQSWDLGICRDNVKRKGKVTMSPQNGFWAIRLYDGEYWALTSPETRLTLRERPLSVGVFLDYEAGEVSFCNMTDGSHIFTFPKNTFYGVLRPLFRLWSSGSGPLSIVHVEEK